MKKISYTIGICCIVIGLITVVAFAMSNSSNSDAHVSNTDETNVSEQLLSEGEMQQKISLAIDSASKTYRESEFDVWQSGTYPNLTVNVRSKNDAVLAHFSNTLEPSGISVIKITQTPLGANPEELIAPEFKAFLSTERNIMGYAFDIKTGDLVIDVVDTQSIQKINAALPDSINFPIRFQVVGKINDQSNTTGVQP